MQHDTTRCKGTCKDGSPCGSTIVGSDGWCYLHNPGNRPRLKEIHAAGGRAKGASVRASKLVPAVLRPVLEQLLAAMGQIQDGSLDPRQASAMASVAGAITRVYQAGTLEERLQALEAQQGGKGA